MIPDEKVRAAALASDDGGRHCVVEGPAMDAGDATRLVPE